MPITASYVAAALALSACVTINVYFPAAEAKEAAKEFVEKVIGDEVQQAAPQPDGGMALRGTTTPGTTKTGVAFDPLMLLGIAPAHAQGQPNFNIKTPAIQAIQARMDGRFASSLRAHFNSGALGFTNDGLVSVRDASKIALKDRVAVNQAVADQNRDAKAVYREVAVANDHPEWEGQIRGVFAKQWIASAKGGWWYQDAGGAWKQK
jgi:uncharacterized protein YdbL (DUF1318 family)